MHLSMMNIAQSERKLYGSPRFSLFSFPAALFFMSLLSEEAEMPQTLDSSTRDDTELRKTGLTDILSDLSIFFC